MTQKILKMGFITAACLFVLCAIYILTSCKTQYIPVPEYHYRDSVRVLKQHDSIFREIRTNVRDSMSVEQKGDTTIIRNFHYESTFDYNSMMQQILDSLSTAKKDSIRVPYPVEKQLSKWEKIKMDFGNAAIGISIATILVLIFYVVRWLRQKKILNF